MAISGFPPPRPSTKGANSLTKLPAFTSDDLEATKRLTFSPILATKTRTSESSFCFQISAKLRKPLASGTVTSLAIKLREPAVCTFLKISSD